MPPACEVPKAEIFIVGGPHCARACANERAENGRTGKRGGEQRARSRGPATETGGCWVGMKGVGAEEPPHQPEAA